MIFQHTLPQVLSSEKNQTARIWKPYYRIGNLLGPFSDLYQEIGYGSFLYLWSIKSGKPRRVWKRGQELAVQPGRGKRSVARIRILKMWRQDVRTYDDDDAHREGFSGLFDFLNTWVWMHDMYAAAYQDDQTAGDWYALLQQRPPKRYMALCLQFKLVEVRQGAVE